MEEEKKVIRGYKGFDKDLRCLGFQYEVGKEYECEKAVACEEGFHFCENPLDVFKFYPPSTSKGPNRFCEVEGSGDFDRDDAGDKICCTKIKIIRELSLRKLVEKGVNFLLADTEHNNYKVGKNTVAIDKNTCNPYVVSNMGNCSAAINYGFTSISANVGGESVSSNIGGGSIAANTGIHSVSDNMGSCSVAANTGDCSTSINSGLYSLAATTGDQSVATNTGICSVAINLGKFSAACAEGEGSIAISAGIRGKAKGTFGNWIVLTERGQWNGNYYPVKAVKAFKVDGKNIKPDTFYQLIDGKPVEATE